MFARERNAVRAKIERIIDLHETVRIDQLMNTHSRKANASFSQKDWLKRSKECADHSGIEWSEQKQEQSDKIAKTMI